MLIFVPLIFLLNIQYFPFDAYSSDPINPAEKSYVENRDDLTVALDSSINQIEEPATSTEENKVWFQIYVLNPGVVSRYITNEYYEKYISCIGRENWMSIPDVILKQVGDWFPGHITNHPEFGRLPMAKFEGVFPIGEREVICTVIFTEHFNSPPIYKAIKHQGELSFPVIIKDMPPKDVTPPMIKTPLAFDKKLKSVKTLIHVGEGNQSKVSYSALINVTDDIDPKPQLNCNPPSDSYFPLGITDVTCTAKDGSGNTNFFTFKIQVKNPQPLSDAENTEPPPLGVTGINVTPEIADEMNLTEAKGFLVIDVNSDSPADKAGIRGGYKVEIINNTQIRLGGDVIIGIDNITINNVTDIRKYLETKKEGNVVKLALIREGKQLNISASLEILIEPEPPTDAENTVLAVTEKECKKMEIIDVTTNGFENDPADYHPGRSFFSFKQGLMT